MRHPGLARRVHRALELTGLTCDGVHAASLFGDSAWLATQVDPVEEARRHAVGLGSVRQRDLLRVLSELPEGCPVPLDELTHDEASELRDAPAGCVELRGEDVIRRLRPVVRLRCAVVVDDDLDRGLDRASRYAPFCPRLVLLTEHVPEHGFVMSEAAFYGIGVVDGSAADRDPLVRLAPDHSARRFGPVAWRVSEHAYEELVCSAAA